MIICAEWSIYWLIDWLIDWLVDYWLIYLTIHQTINWSLMEIFFFKLARSVTFPQTLCSYPCRLSKFFSYVPVKCALFHDSWCSHLNSNDVIRVWPSTNVNTSHQNQSVPMPTWVITTNVNISLLFFPLVRHFGWSAHFPSFLSKLLARLLSHFANPRAQNRNKSTSSVTLITNHLYWF